MTYDVASQLQYTNIAYRTKSGLPAGATIASGGCGPSSVRNLGNNLLGWNTTIPKVAAIAVDCGARYNGGTTISTLLAALKTKSGYGGFTYEYTTSDATAIAAVKAGAMAIIHTAGAVGGTYNKLLSSSGHFLCFAAVSGTTATIIDSCSYSGKWTANSVRKKYITTTSQTGVVQCSTSALSAAVDYYYIVKKAAGMTNTTEKGKDVSDMTETEVRKIIESVATETAKRTVSAWAENAWSAATQAGVMDGTAPQGNVTREQLAQVLANMGLIGGEDTPSDWAAQAFAAATDAGVLDGTNPHGLVTREQLAQVLVNVGLVGTGQKTDAEEPQTE